jgi:hypothetical protein
MMKVKKTSQRNNAFKVIITKIFFNPQTLQIIFIRSHNSFSIQFWYKKLFFLFFSRDDHFRFGSVFIKKK